MAGHEDDVLVQSTDGGETWTTIPVDAGMTQPSSSASTVGISFIDTGDASTTRSTWLWVGPQTGGNLGTWRTIDGGTSWTQVDKNEHPHAFIEPYQPDTSGVLYMAGAYSALGWGVLRSTDYGQTWTHVGAQGNETIVFGTNRFVYAMYGWAAGPGQSVPPALQVAAQPGTGTWTMPATPGSMLQGPTFAIVTNDGTYDIIVTANFNSGLWRYVEPKN
jgi:hypothetical protein